MIGRKGDRHAECSQELPRRRGLRCRFLRRVARAGSSRRCSWSVEGVCLVRSQGSRLERRARLRLRGIRPGGPRARPGQCTGTRGLPGPHASRGISGVGDRALSPPRPPQRGHAVRRRLGRRERPRRVRPHPHPAAAPHRAQAQALARGGLRGAGGRRQRRPRLPGDVRQPRFQHPEAGAAAHARLGERRRAGGAGHQDRPGRRPRLVRRAGAGGGLRRDRPRRLRPEGHRPRGGARARRPGPDRRAHRVVRRREVHAHQPPARGAGHAGPGAARRRRPRPAHDHDPGALRAAGRRLRHRHPRPARRRALGERGGARGGLRRDRGARGALPVQRLPPQGRAGLRGAGGGGRGPPRVVSQAAAELAHVRRKENRAEAANTKRKWKAITKRMRRRNRDT
jgi:hypothetical protein